MWINQIVYKTLLSSWNEQLAALRAQIASVELRCTQVQRRNTLLEERLLTAEAEARSAKAMRDLLVVQNAQLQEERGQFLQKVLDPDFRPVIRVPKIQTMPTVTAPGVDFEDMGDDMARHSGYADHIPVNEGEHVLERQEEITGLTGQVYDPASELGAEHERLPDGPSLHPEL
jgi:hypothetical protein